MGYKDTEVGRIPIEWEVSQLVDNAEITMGQSPKSEFYNNEGIGIPFMQGRKTFGDKYHEIDTWCTDPKRFAKKDDVLISVRAPVGDVNIAKMDLCIGRGLASLRMKNGNNEFLYYLIKNYSDILISRGTGTVFSSINKAGLETLKLPFPPDEEQKAIAHILSTLDEKIEVNNQINRTLEKIAQTIFKHWFVDFEFPNENGEPYKSSGGEMVESELGLIPKGWEVVKLDEIVQISTESVSPNKYDKQIFEHYSIPALDERRFPIFELGREIKSNKYKVYSNSILISKLNPTIKRIWRPLCLTENSVCSTEFINYIPINDEIKEFCYEVINSERFLSFLINHATGSTGSRQRVKPLDTLSYKFAKPMDIELLIKYSKITKELYEIIDDKILENQKIIQLRDTLLPKLMSGEIRVPLDDENDIS